MITEKEFNAAFTEFKAKMKCMEDALEDLYQNLSTSSNNEVKQAARNIERIQFDAFSNPLTITTDGFIHQVKEVIRLQETMENLNKMDKYMKAMKSIRNTLNNLDEE